MAFTFDDTLATARDEVRLNYGDTDANDVIHQDETLDALLVKRSNNVLLTSIDACRTAIAALSRKVDRSAVGISASRSQKASNLRETLKDLRAQLRLDGADAFAGGISKARNRTIAADTDYDRPAFTVGMDDSPLASNENRLDPDDTTVP